MPLCSLPRSNPGNRHQYKRADGPYKLIMIAGGDNKLPFGNLPRLRESGPGGAGRTGAGTSGLGSVRRSARNGGGFSGGGGRSSGNWRDGARGVGQSFTGVKSGSGSSWRKTAMECWGAFGLGGSSVANCERSVGRSGDAREVLGRFREELEHRQRWERVSLGKAHSGAVREIESKAGGVYRSWMEGAEERARERRRGGTDSQCITIIVAKTGTGSSARRRRSGWSRCGRSTESRLTRR